MSMMHKKYSPDSKGTKKSCVRCQELLRAIHACGWLYDSAEHKGYVSEMKSNRLDRRWFRKELADHVQTEHHAMPGEKCLYAQKLLTDSAIAERA